jgi:biotin carboxyl carrier protein
MIFEVELDGTTTRVSVETKDGRTVVRVGDGAAREIDVVRPEPGILSIVLDGKAYDVATVRTEAGYDVDLRGVRHSVGVVDPRKKALRLAAGSNQGSIKTTMPGRVVRALVKEGESVEAGPARAGDRGDEDGERAQGAASGNDPARRRSSPVRSSRRAPCSSRSNEEGMTKKERWKKETLGPHAAEHAPRKKAFVRSGWEPVEELSGPSDPPDEIGLPGEFPYTRGIHPTMYRGRLWTMRQYAGFGTAKESNARYRYLLSQGQTGSPSPSIFRRRWDSTPMRRKRWARSGVSVSRSTRSTTCRSFCRGSRSTRSARR